MKKKFFFLPLSILITLILVSFPANANDIQIRYPFVFTDRFPGSVQQLGFPKGIVLQIGAYIYSALDEDNNPIPITRVTAENLDTGDELELYSLSLPIFEGVYINSPIPLNPDYHMGVWRIGVEDEAGNLASANTHDLDIDGAMPYVKDIQASGDPLAPIITWRGPKEKRIPESCFVRYRIRLLKNFDDIFC